VIHCPRQIILSLPILIIPFIIIISYKSAEDIQDGLGLVTIACQGLILAVVARFGTINVQSI
jgi:hypothetical protein